MKLPTPGPKIVAVDTETTGLHPDPPEGARVAIVSVAWRGERGALHTGAWPFGFGPGRGAQPTLGLEPDVNLGQREWRGLLAWLGQRKLVMHGGKFDLMMVGVGTDRFAGIDLAPQFWWDTLLASRDLDPNIPAGLEDVELRLRYLTPQRRQEWIASKKRRGQVNAMEWEQARAYAATDAEITLVAFEEQYERYECGEASLAEQRREVAVSRALLALERRGIAYDVQRSREVATALRAQEVKVRKGLPFRPTTAGAVKYFFLDAGREPTERTDTGKPRMDEREAARLTAEGVPFAAEYARLRHYESARSKWYDSYADHCGWDGRLRTVYSQASVVTGRFSSTRVNLQAIPHDYQLGAATALGLATPRQLFHAAPGKQLWEVDLGQAELRVAAQAANCVRMLQAIHTGEDLHSVTAIEVFHDSPGSPSWAKNRDASKRANFSLIFGISIETFYKVAVLGLHPGEGFGSSGAYRLGEVSGLDLSREETTTLVKGWRKLYPEYSPTVFDYKARVERVGYVRLVNGRVRYFTAFEQTHKAFNGYVQGSLAELMKVWMLAIEERYPGVCLLTIHDSFVLELPSKTARRIVGEVAALGAQLGTDMFGVPMVVDIKRWGDK